MWVLNSDRDILINLKTGLRIVIMPTKKEGEVQLYGVVVQTPAEATLPVGRPLPTGYSNTMLVHSLPLDDCRNLLEILEIKLDAWRVPTPPIDELEYDPACFLHITDSLGNPWRYICENEDVAWKILFGYVKNQWPHSLVKNQPMPEDWQEAIRLYFEHKQSKEDYSLFASQLMLSRAMQEG